MKRRHRRIGFILVGLAGLTIATILVARAFRNNLVFFFSPTQVAAKEAPINRTFRVGGLVEGGTLQRDKDGLTVRFVVTDTAASVPVVYKGIRLDCGFRVDMLINGDVIVEVKSVAHLLSIHSAQVITYLRLTDARRALLFNFSALTIKAGMKSFLGRGRGVPVDEDAG